VIDLALTTDDELQMTNGDLTLIADSDQVAQHLRTRLHLFYNEWIFDPGSGVKYVEEVLVKSPDLTIVDGLMKATILDTPGVVELTNYVSTFDDATRVLSITGSYRDVYSETVIYFEEELP
jgi:hypothetical protein